METILDLALHLDLDQDLNLDLLQNLHSDLDLDLLIDWFNTIILLMSKLLMERSKMECSQCHKSFTRSDNLRRHMKIHNRPTPRSEEQLIIIKQKFNELTKCLMDYIESLPSGIEENKGTIVACTD